MPDKSSAAARGHASRRDFLKGSTAALAGATLAGTLGIARSAHAAGDEQIKIALIGCGGRGTGAANQALSTKGDVKLIAMADMFRDSLDASLNNLLTLENIKSKIDVPEDRKFVGYDAYQKALDAGPDMVILATPPGFRPQHFEAAVKAGKHVFMEKPVATDPSGVRTVLAAAEESKKKGLAVGVGLQRRHQAHYVEAIKRIHDGAIGDISTLRVYWNGWSPWVHKRAELQEQYPGLTEMGYQLRNWYYFTWICGDHIVEQHIHNMDVANWIKQALPIKANGMGGCEVRKSKDHGETFDHHCVEFEYPDGSRMFSQCRHIRGCWNWVAEHAHGTHGTADLDTSSARIRVPGWEQCAGAAGDPDPYQVEHDVLFESIRKGEPINEAEYGAASSMTAILGRMCTYSGQELTWDQALNSQVSIMPQEYSMEATPPVVPGPDGMYPRAIPGITKVV